jgi:hypothetical protein
MLIVLIINKIKHVKQYIKFLNTSDSSIYFPLCFKFNFTQDTASNSNSNSVPSVVFKNPTYAVTSFAL